MPALPNVRHYSAKGYWDHGCGLLIAAGPK
jgi:hypothetical protein